MTYAVDVIAERNEQPSRWYAVFGLLFFLKGILLIPHLIILWVLNYAFQLLTWIGYILVAFTGAYPDWLYTFNTGFLRWAARTTLWFAGNVDDYPPFTFDEGGYGVDAVFEPNHNPSRGWAIAGIFWIIKPIALIPHIIVLIFLWIGMFFGIWVGFLIVTFTGKLPDGLQDFFAGVMRWQVRVQAWWAGLVDDYPPFRLSP